MKMNSLLNRKLSFSKKSIEYTHLLFGPIRDWCILPEVRFFVT